MKVKFLIDRTVQDGHKGSSQETKFKAGQIVELPESSAMHWISRGAAEPHDPAAEKKATQEKAAGEKAGRKEQGADQGAGAAEK